MAQAPEEGREKTSRFVGVSRASHSTQVIRHFGQVPFSSGVRQTKQRSDTPVARGPGSDGGAGSGGGTASGWGGDRGAGSSGAGGPERTPSDGPVVGTGAPGAGSSSERGRRRRNSIAPFRPGRFYTLRAGAAGPRCFLAAPVRAGVNPPSERLRELGIALPPPPKPVGAYVPVARAGELAWVSGQIAVEGGVPTPAGSVDRDVPLDVARATARRAALQGVSALANELGSIDHIGRIVRVGVFVAVSPGFHREHEVANGATELLVELFGDHGRPSRFTVGVASLPLGAPVEVEMLATVRG